jgi:hypothetical protein
MVFPSHDVPRRLDYRLFYDKRAKKNCKKESLTLQGGHLKITAVGPLAVVFFNYPFKFCSKLYYTS